MEKKSRYVRNKRALRMPRIKLPELPWRGVLAGCFFVCFLCGILAANWVGREKLIQYGMMNQYYVGQLVYTDINAGLFFAYLAKHRLRVFALAALFAYTRFGVLAVLGVIGWYAFSVGYLFVNALVCMKFQGMVLVLLSIFPQVFCYAMAYYGLAKIIFWKNLQPMRTGVHKIWKNPRLLLLLSSFLILVAGIWLEAYINPLLLKWYIRRI